MQHSFSTLYLMFRLQSLCIERHFAKRAREWSASRRRSSRTKIEDVDTANRHAIGEQVMSSNTSQSCRHHIFIHRCQGTEHNVIAAAEGARRASRHGVTIAACVSGITQLLAVQHHPAAVAAGPSPRTKAQRTARSPRASWVSVATIWSRLGNIPHKRRMDQRHPLRSEQGLVARLGPEHNSVVPVNMGH